eukprot:365303-Chlamydomonas_euryale.AAC.40
MHGAYASRCQSLGPNLLCFLLLQAAGAIILCCTFRCVCAAHCRRLVRIVTCVYGKALAVAAVLAAGKEAASTPRPMLCPCPCPHPCAHPPEMLALAHGCNFDIAEAPRRCKRAWSSLGSEICRE